MRSDFENHFRKTLFYSNMLTSAAENGIAISPFEMVRGQYRNTYVQLAYSVYSHQQSKVDELQKQLIDQGQRFNEQVQHVRDLEHKNGELQKRVDDLTELNRLKTIALQQSVNRTSPYVHEKIVALEQALKGGGE